MAARYGAMDEARSFLHQETLKKSCSPEPSTELTRTKAMARELARQIEDANARANRHRSELQTMRKSFRRPKIADTGEAARELDEVMREVRRMRLSVKSAMDAKKKSENELAAWEVKLRAGELALEEMRKEMADADEEYVIVELARIEAEKERREIDAQRAAEAERFAGEIASARKKIKALQKNAKRAKELEAKLAAAESDVSVLRSEMEMVRAMDVKPAAAAPAPESDEAAALEKELREAKRKLAEIKEEGFRFMATMDVARMEMSRVEKEIGRLREKERRADDAMQRLNAKLLKAKSQLQSALVADERTTAILANLTSAQQQLKTDVETANDERAAIEQEAKSFRAATADTHLEAASVEATLAARARELEAVKAAEAAAMRKLENAVERAMRAKAAASSGSSSVITITKFEYEYLTRQANMARAVAEKKTAAARAWVEAIKARETEIALRTEHVAKEIKDIAAKQEQRDADGGASEEELATEEEEELQPARKSRRESRASMAPRRARLRLVSVASSSAAAAAQLGRSSSVNIVRQRRAVVPNVMKLIRERRAMQK